MHESNDLFWAYCREKYKQWFDGPNRVLEVGSLDINGSVRKHFTGFTEYIGVDWRPGPCVDVVSLAKDMSFPGTFDTVISASMLEHDPQWRESIHAMCKYVAPGGILLLSWGAALNGPHEPDAAIDGKFYALPAARVIVELVRLGFYVHEFHYEGNLTPEATIKKGVLGEVVLVAFPERDAAPVDKPSVDKLLDEDFA